MRRIGTFIKVFLLWTLVGMVSKVVFLLVYHSLLEGAGLGSQLLVVWYGLRLDVAMAGYLTLIPGLLLIASVWTNWRLFRWLWNGYFAVASPLAVLAYIANLGLYGYWGFPLDNTPLLYLTTSPTDAMASLTWWQLTMLPLTIVFLSLALFQIGTRLYPKKVYQTKGRIVEYVLLPLLTVSLLLPIRGGVSTGTNHTGSVYFSDNIRLNHAAVNPIFSFMEAVLHQEEIGTRYRFMADDEATALFGPLTYTSLRTDTANFQRPNIILIVLESFSDSVMRVQGVTPNLLRLTTEGLYFPRFYANSFRTDRALVSIHSGLPAQPTMSVMDMPRKSTSLPAIAGQLARNGYQTTFYYGGDINYSNMRSYFVGTGFQTVVSDSDFPARQHTGKWGVADGPVFERMLADLKTKSSKPFFCSIMTASSHEPFDVPDYHVIKENEALNAFSYSDYCLGQFIKQLKTLPSWENTLVAIVPDHLGAWPENADNYQLWRYHIPFVIVGGAIKAGTQCHVVGSQIDIAATLLGLAGIDHSGFTYSKDLLDANAPHFAFFSFPDAMGMVTDSSSIVFNNITGKVQSAVGNDTERLLTKAKAYLQKLYDDLEKK